MRIETHLRPFIYVDDVRHEIISPPGVLIGAQIGKTGYCVIAVQKDPVGSHKQFVRINDNSKNGGLSRSHSEIKKSHQLVGFYKFFTNS